MPARLMLLLLLLVSIDAVAAAAVILLMIALMLVLVVVVVAMPRTVVHPLVGLVLVRAVQVVVVVHRGALHRHGGVRFDVDVHVVNPAVGVAHGGERAGEHR